jgi:hypothetical protein
VLLYDYKFVLICIQCAPLSTLFQLYYVNQFYWWWKPEYTEKTTDLTQVTGNLYQKTTDLTQVTGNLYQKTTDLTQVNGKLYQKTTDLTQVTSKIVHIMLYRVSIT